MKYILALIFIALSTLSYSQNAYRQKVYAFFQKQENGDSKHFIYIEMPGDSIPIWDSAIIGGHKYVVHFSLVETMPLRIGERKSDKKMVVIKSAPDTKMYTCDFDETGEIVANSEKQPAAPPVILKGKFKGRKLTYKILTEIELE